MIGRFFSPLLYFTEFATVDRNKLQEQHTSSLSNDEFDSTLHGPWMNRWEIVHHNRHTHSLNQGSSWDSPTAGDKA